MFSLADFLDAVKDELGDAEQLVRDEQFTRWVNRGRHALGIYQPRVAELTWTANADGVALPPDYSQLQEIVPASGTTIPVFRVVGNKPGGGPELGDPPPAAYLAFIDPSCVSGGTATLYYGVDYPAITGAVASTMPAAADEAVVSYALARFFKRVAASRADFRRYVTVTGQNGIEVADLLELADQHSRDFLDQRAGLAVQAPTTYFGD